VGAPGDDGARRSGLIEARDDGACIAKGVSVGAPGDDGTRRSGLVQHFYSP
jgi:hypothetical protein